MEKNDLISRSELHRMLSSWDWQDLYLPIHFSDLVAEQKAVDAVPVVHGRLIDKCAWHTECEKCGYVFETICMVKNYCPNCGAKMDGDSNSD